MMLARPPIASLAPFVQRIWASEELAGARKAAREWVLPTGLMHIVLRLSSAPLRVYADARSEQSQWISRAVIGGARSGPYVRDVSCAVSSVGAELLPGAARWLFGAPADQLAGVHTPLEALWSPVEVESARDQLASAPTLTARLCAFEALLVARLPAVRGLHPAVAEALAKLAGQVEVSVVVRESGYSHRGFNTLFCAAVGLTPKLYGRVQRFSAGLQRVHAGEARSLAALALAAGYSDQAHFNRDFRAFAGVSPGQYRKLSPTFAHHLAVVAD